MGKPLSRIARHVARAKFREAWKQTGDVETAAARAGVSERTGHRWRPDLDATVQPGRDAGPSTDFIGRDAELGRLWELLRERGRIVTVVGPPGIGKTTLAKRYAELFAHEYTGEGAAYVVDLSTAGTEEDACRRLGRALDVALVTADAASVAEHAGSLLAMRSDVLVVLDGLDAERDFAGPLVETWRALARDAHFVVTARRPLDSAAEVPMVLAGLAMDDEPGDAVELFARRARRCPASDLNVEERQLIGALVRRLDGNPMAIELAASRVWKTGLVASSGAAATDDDPDPLMRELHKSCNELTVDERLVLAQCAVFRGGFRVEAAEAILAAPSGVELDVVKTLGRLHARSLLRVQHEPTGPRYHTTGILGSDTVPRRELGDAHRRHAAYYLRVATQPLSVDLLGEELANVWAAIDYTLAAHTESPDAAERIARALVGLAPVAMNAGPLEHYLRAVDAVAPLATEDAVDARTRASLSAIHGRVLGAGGRVAEAQDHAKAAVRLARRCGDRTVEAAALRDLGVLAKHQGELARARRWLAAAVVLGDASAPHDRALTLLHVSEVCARLGRFEEAVRHADQAARLFREAGGESRLARALHCEAISAYWAQRLGQARRAWESALERVNSARSVADRQTASIASAGLALVSWEQGRLVAAREHLERAYTTARRAGLRQPTLVAAGYRAAVLCHEGDLARGIPLLERTVASLHRHRLRFWAALFQSWLGAAYASAGEVQASRASFDEAAAFFGPMGVSAFDALLTLHRAHLDLLEARRAADRGDDQAEARWRDQVRERCDAVADQLTPGPLRLAFLWLRATHDRECGVQERWRVTRDGSAIRRPGGERIQLPARGPMARLVALLAQQQRRDPGRALSPRQLVEQTWPSVPAQTGRRRLATMLSRLRDKGLHELLQRNQRGYYLDPSVSIDIVDDL